MDSVQEFCFHITVCSIKGFSVYMCSIINNKYTHTHTHTHIRARARMCGQTGSHVGFIQGQFLLTKITGVLCALTCSAIRFFLSVLKVD